MIDDKRIGEYCTFAKRYVPITTKYFPNGTSSKSCENSACGNPECNLSDNFRENKTHGKNALGQPDHDIE